MKRILVLLSLCLLLSGCSKSTDLEDNSSNIENDDLTIENEDIINEPETDSRVLVECIS